jgi:hypothetical protein
MIRGSDLKQMNSIHSNQVSYTRPSRLPPMHAGAFPIASPENQAGACS